MSVPRSLDGFDVAAAVARMLGEPTLWWQALGLFVTHFADWEPRWLGCAGDLPAEQKLVHALRSAAANVGAAGLADQAAALENALLACRAGEADAVPAALREDLRDAYRRVWRSAADAVNSDSPGR